MTIPDIKSTKTRAGFLELLDFCKGLGIGLVFLVHYQTLNVGWQGVHLFIVLSGFGLMYSCLKQGTEPSWNTWYFKRLRRILPAYWLTALCGFLVASLFALSQGNGLLQAMWLSKRSLLLDMTLLKSVYHASVITFPNVSLWFVPFIISFYLIFPVLYRWLSQCRSGRQVLVFLGSMVAIELVYRAIALYWLDGFPIGYAHVKDLFPALSLPLDKIPDTVRHPFQLYAPFCFFPSRIGEFALGMVAAVAFTRNASRFSQIILNAWTGLLGFSIWVVANALISNGFIGWVVGDFLIAVGLMLWIVNVAQFCQKYLVSVFSLLSQVGVLSFYIYLTHALFVQSWVVYARDYMVNGIELWKNPVVNLAVLVVMVVCTYGASKLLQHLDQSKYTDWLFKSSVGKVLKPA